MALSFSPFLHVRIARSPYVAPKAVVDLLQIGTSLGDVVLAVLTSNGD